MVAVLDIGNTNIHFGLYDGEALVNKATYPLNEKSSEKMILKILRRKRVSGAAIASVVPGLTAEFARFFQKDFGISPIIVSANLNLNLKFGYRKPETLGADRIAGVVGGLARYKSNLLIAGFGTATTLDAVLKNGHYLGGIISPGINMLMDVLSKRTALLQKVPLKRPVRVIGRSTEECMRSGIFNGTGAMISGLIQRIRREHKKRFLCVATGGWGKPMSLQIKEIKHFDPDLCTFGVMKIYHYNA